MQTLAEIKSLLADRGFSPRKAFGQNFLIDHNLIRKLVDAADVGAGGDVVLEVGPGTGTMTEELLSRGCTVIAAEIDIGLSAMLRDRFATHGSRFRLIEGDCLAGKRALAPPLIEAIDAARAGRPFKLISNLPYAAGTSVMNILLADHPECAGLFVTVQREVAERLAAAPGSKDYGPISILAQAVASVKVIGSLPPECFWPRPEVHSAMLALRRLPEPLTRTPRALVDFAQRVFEKRRKQLGAILGRNRPWPSGIEAIMRAEDLSVADFVRLEAAFGDVFAA